MVTKGEREGGGCYTDLINDTTVPFYSQNVISFFFGEQRTEMGI